MSGQGILRRKSPLRQAKASTPKEQKDFSSIMPLNDEMIVLCVQLTLHSNNESILERGRGEFESHDKMIQKGSQACQSFPRVVVDGLFTALGGWEGIRKGKAIDVEGREVKREKIPMGSGSINQRHGFSSARHKIIQDKRIMCLVE